MCSLTEAAVSALGFNRSGCFSSGVELACAQGKDSLSARMRPQGHSTILILFCVTNSRAGCAYSTHLASSKSSVPWEVLSSYFILHCTISALPLNRTQSSSDLASCSSSYCSCGRSWSHLADCRAWARALCDLTDTTHV